MARIPIALELYSVREELAADALGTLNAVAQMGYEGVEFAGPPRHEAKDLREMLDQTGLVCCGWHTPFALVQDDKLDETIEFNRTLGNANVIVPGIPAELRRTRADWRKMADFFNVLAGRLAPHGMRTGYHNHHVEFAELDGERPWDTFFDNTADAVIMQLDTGNAMAGGGDPLAILRSYPGRARTVHLKPYDVQAGRENMQAGFRPIIGEDSTPWAQLFEVCETTAGTRWYIVEYESDAYPPMQAVEKCRQALRAMGK